MCCPLPCLALPPSAPASNTPELGIAPPLLIAPPCRPLLSRLLVLCPCASLVISRNLPWGPFPKGLFPRDEYPY